MIEPRDRDALTGKIIACAYRVHSKLGPGFNESVYQNALKIILEEQNLKYQTERSFNVLFQNKNVGRLRLDLIVNDEVVVEIKAVSGHMPVLFESQLLSYLKATEYKIGLLINFGYRSCQVRRLML